MSIVWYFLLIHDIFIYVLFKIQTGESAKMAEIRLHKYMAEAGVASRRKCEELIAMGRVEVNGEKVTLPGMKITGKESIKVDGRAIKHDQKKVYILLNKPVGYISTAKDQFSRKTVLDLTEGVKERIYPVGRLDYDTSGLIILTNDGELANMLTHPKHEIHKVYKAIISGHLKDEDIEKLQNGVVIDDYKTAPARINSVEILKTTSIVEISIHEGKNRQVRKMFEVLGYAVLRLKRIAIGPIVLGDLEEGKWRYFRKKEIEALVKSAAMRKYDH